jgi:DNA invertase Pin-like site-specific DNA recombinase
MPRGDHALRAPRLIDEERDPGGGPRVAKWDSDERMPRPVPDVEIVALGYVSAHDPAHDDELHRQAAAIHGFCSLRGWGLAGLVRDIGEPHRKCLRRPSLINAIDRLRAGEASYLVLAELRRLCSSVAELGRVLDIVEDTGARLVSLDPPMDTGTRSGRTALRALMSVSAWERARRSEMISAARARVAAQQAIPPPLKRRIERMRGAGLTLQAIADTLNEEGIPTARGGAKWRPSSLQSALGYRRPAS